MSDVTKFQLGPNQLKWISLLEKTKRKQGVGRLAYRDHDNIKYCCLGIGCLSLGHKARDVIKQGNALRGSQILSLGLFNDIGSTREHEGNSLAVLNDSMGKTFKQIAAILRENPELYFVRSK